MVESADSWPGRQKACIGGWVELAASSVALSSAGMGRTWKGPAANPMCWAEVMVDWENTNIDLLELYGCATYKPHKIPAID